MSDKATFAVGQVNENYPASVKNMLEQGKDPKDLLIQVCRPQCQFYDDKYDRCVVAYHKLQNADPEKNCVSSIFTSNFSPKMYPYRDLITCIEACVQPKIQHLLRGNEPGRFFG